MAFFCHKDTTALGSLSKAHLPKSRLQIQRSVVAFTLQQAQNPIAVWHRERVVDCARIKLTKVNCHTPFVLIFQLAVHYQAREPPRTDRRLCNTTFAESFDFLASEFQVVGTTIIGARGIRSPIGQVYVKFAAAL